MVQRVWQQLAAADLSSHCLVCAGEEQTELLRVQLGDVPLVTEPSRRDTFPAVALSCAYLRSKMNAPLQETVCIMPADPYADSSYFEALKQMPQVLTASGAQAVLLGIKPTACSSQYGYILPESRQDNFIHVKGFVEKPTAEKAKTLLAQGALWNGGVFCLQIGTVLEALSSMGLPTDYDALWRDYSHLPAISFDYAFVEKCSHLAALPFDGEWKDIGTWPSIAATLGSGLTGDIRADDSCRNIYARNETNIPAMLSGIEDLTVVISYDGILITGANETGSLKPMVDALPPRPTFEETRWGISTVLDYFEENETAYLTRKIRIHAEKSAPAQILNAAGQLMVLQGTGSIALPDNEYALSPGQGIALPAGVPYRLHAGKSGLLLLTAQQGKPALLF